MGKKRKVLWIAGSVVLLLLAFGTVASIVGPNPERLLGEVQAVARDYGFVKVQRPVPFILLIEGRLESESYDAKGLDESEIESIAERLASACKRCKRSEVTDGSGGTAWTPAASERLSIVARVYTSAEDDVVSMDVIMHRKFRPSLWQRIKRLWPW